MYWNDQMYWHGGVMNGWMFVLVVLALIPLWLALAVGIAAAMRNAARPERGQTPDQGMLRSEVSNPVRPRKFSRSDSPTVSWTRPNICDGCRYCIIAWTTQGCRENRELVRMICSRSERTVSGVLCEAR